MEGLYLKYQLKRLKYSFMLKNKQLMGVEKYLHFFYYTNLAIILLKAKLIINPAISMDEGKYLLSM